MVSGSQNTLHTDTYLKIIHNFLEIVGVPPPTPYTLS